MCVSRIKKSITNDNRSRKFKVCCPICGCELMKSAKADDEIKCTRCKEHIVVFIQNERILLTIDQRERKLRA